MILASSRPYDGSDGSGLLMNVIHVIRAGRRRSRLAAIAVAVLLLTGALGSPIVFAVTDATLSVQKSTAALLKRLAEVKPRKRCRVVRGGYQPAPACGTGGGCQPCGGQLGGLGHSRPADWLAEGMYCCCMPAQVCQRAGMPLANSLCV